MLCPVSGGGGFCVGFGQGAKFAFSEEKKGSKGLTVSSAAVEQKKTPWLYETRGIPAEGRKPKPGEKGRGSALDTGGEGCTGEVSGRRDAGTLAIRCSPVEKRVCPRKEPAIMGLGQKVESVAGRKEHSTTLK